MAERGITLYVIACEPTLSQSYSYAVDFYRALCKITSGRIVPLTDASKLGDYIVGSAVETMETEKLIGEFEKTILDDVYRQGKSIEEVTANVQQQMASQNVQINTMLLDNTYANTERSDANVAIWMSAVSIQEARGKVVGSIIVSAIPTPMAPVVPLSPSMPGAMAFAGGSASALPPMPRPMMQMQQILMQPQATGGLVGGLTGYAAPPPMPAVQFASSGTTGPVIAPQMVDYDQVSC